jgi:hypothetical protein
MSPIDYRAAILRMLAGEDDRLDSVRICLSRDAERKLQAATAALAKAAADAPRDEDGKPRRKVAGDPIQQAQKALDAAQAEHDAQSLRVVLSGLSAGAWSKLQIKWGTESEQLEGEAKAAYVIGQDRELVLACFHRWETIEGEPIADLTKDDLARLIDPDNRHALTASQQRLLVRCAYDLCTQEPDLPSSALR